MHGSALGHATNNHIRVHPEQPQGEDAFGYAVADIPNTYAERKQYDEAGSDMGNGVRNASVDGPSHTLKTRGLESTLKEDAEVSHRRAPVHRADLLRYAFNYRAGYTAENHFYAKETVIAAFREHTPSFFLLTPLRPSLWVVLTVHLVLYITQGNVGYCLARHYFQNDGKDGQVGRKKGPLPIEDRLAKVLDLAA
eukprot:jgi/Tetstr1/459472/TSEL_004839.t1